jgi:hypothetical protein
MPSTVAYEAACADATHQSTDIAKLNVRGDEFWAFFPNHSAVSASPTLLGSAGSRALLGFRALPSIKREQQWFRALLRAREYH